MKLLQLRYLLAIADNGLNITTAANRLYTSQPGVSKQLKLLEEELGVELFARNGRRLVEITAAGRQIIVHARVIMREVEGIRSLIRELLSKGGSRGLSANDSGRCCCGSERADETQMRGSHTKTVLWQR